MQLKSGFLLLTIFCASCGFFARELYSQDQAGDSPAVKETTAGWPSDSLSPVASDTSQLLRVITVTAIKPAAGSFSPRSIISGEKLEKAKGGTLAEVIRSIPGVTMLQTGASIAKPVIHGMHSNRILILNNGIRQEGQQWGAEHAPGIDPFIANRISVVKGTETIRFGPGALGGVISIEPAPLPQAAGLHGSLNLAASGNGGAGALSGMLGGGIPGLKGVGWRVQGTARRAGNISTADYYLENTGVKEMAFSAAAGYSRRKMTAELYFSHFKTELGIFRGAHIGNLTDLQARIARGRPGTTGKFSYEIDVPRQEVSHNLLKLKAQLRFSSLLKLSLEYGLQVNHREEYDIRRGGRNSLPSMDLALNTQSLDAFLEKYSGQHWKSTLGLSGVMQVNNTRRGTFAIPLIPNFDSYKGGLYFIQQFLEQDYELEAGIRYDYNYLDALGYDRNQDFYGGTRKFHHISASAGGRRRFGNWQFRTNLGMGWRPPTVNELYSNGLHHGTASYELGDSRLQSEKSYKWITSLSHQGDRWETGISAYVHWFENYIYLNPSLEYVTTMQGAFPTFNYEQTHARFAGTDISGSYLLSTAFRLEVKGSLVRAKDVSHDRYLPWIPSDRVTGSLQWNPADGKPFKDPYLQLQHEYVASQTRYEPESDFAPPPPAYHMWNLNAGTNWSAGAGTLSVHLSLNNITNILYREYMNRFRYYAHDKGRNITLRLAYKF
ncbi:iron complex outermembrane receptor protein [Anseongella ginsenosidimutans]|uniref:Iron complex outermembrane receptor protein n=1 Tax=Anseongella ginsenosidimutans TaxID=496056 RepID=A0A4R3KMJ9_9SPHI|nr:TonB-dependent receptor [Anseongella ginsenosidimutans]QEC52478.1 TonB-dependent receptor [Anseongella ginsenosidimutans]TCS85344.1 iron complex outermembrane receptor protein [Anseongella ginsenosidimutans]